METMVLTPNSICSPPIIGASTSTTAQDDGPVNRLCEAHSNECRTGCFVMRKIIAHVFGRNKACTSQIPDHCWVEWCRKHYQRIRHRMLEQGWIFLQIGCLRTQLGRMEEWGEVQSFTIVLQRRFQEELNGEDLSKNSEDEAGLIDSPDTTTKSNDNHAKEHSKPSSNRFLYPFLGAEKSFGDVYAVIDAVEKAANDGQLTFLPPLQFLPFIDATLHPPPPIARPRKQRKTKVNQKHVLDNMRNNDSHLETLLNSNTAKRVDSSPSSYSSPALKFVLGHNTIKGQIVAELASRPLQTTSIPVTMIPEHEIQSKIISDDDDATAQRIVPDSTDFEVASDNLSPVARPSGSLGGKGHQVGAEAHPIPSLPTIKNGIDEALENEMQDSTVEKNKDSTALTAKFIAKNKQSDVTSNTLQVARTLASQEGGSATEKHPGAIGLLSSRDEKTDNSRKSPEPAPLPPKIQARPPASIPVIDREYGLIGYKTAKQKSDKAARPQLHSTTSRLNAAPLKPTKPLSKNPSTQSNSYPKDPTRTYQSVLNDTNCHVEAPATDKCKDSGMETHAERNYSLEKHSVENEHKNTDTPALCDGKLSATPIPRMGFNGWTPINASSVTTSYAVSVPSMVNTNDDTHSQEALTPDSDTSATSAHSEKFSLAPSPSTDGDANTEPSSFGISANKSIARSVLEPPSRILPFSGSQKRRRNDAEEGSLLEGQSLGKRQMRGLY